MLSQIRIRLDPGPEGRAARRDPRETAPDHQRRDQEGDCQLRRARRAAARGWRRRGDAMRQVLREYLRGGVGVWFTRTRFVSLGVLCAHA
jgi:hypothetical protein